jgi:hypothetical protein
MSRDIWQKSPICANFWKNVLVEFDQKQWELFVFLALQVP